MSDKFMFYSKGVDKALTVSDMERILADVQKEIKAPEIDSYSIHDLKNLKKQIQNFNFEECGKLPMDEIRKKIWDTLLINQRFIGLENTQLCMKEINLFRVRRVDNLMADKNKYKKEDELWSPPTQKVKERGRINKKEESLLYTSPIDPFCAMDEMQVENEEEFLLIRYRMKRSGLMKIIGGPMNYIERGLHNQKTIIVNEMCQFFLNKLFRMKTDVNKEEIYKISNTVIEDFFQLSTEDGWAYCSVKNVARYNFCFNSKRAKEILEVNGVYIAKKNKLGRLEIMDTIRKSKYNDDMHGKYIPKEFEYGFYDLFAQWKNVSENLVDANFFDIEDVNFIKPKTLFYVKRGQQVKILMGVRNGIYNHLNDSIEKVKLYYCYTTNDVQWNRKVFREYKVEERIDGSFIIKGLKRLTMLEFDMPIEGLQIVEIALQYKDGHEERIGGGEFSFVMEEGK